MLWLPENIEKRLLGKYTTLLSGTQGLEQSKNLAYFIPLIHAFTYNMAHL